MTVAVAVLGQATPAHAAADPTSPEPAPRAVEGFAPYLPQVSCDPTVKPGTAAFRAMLVATYGGRDLGVSRACDVGARSEHKEGRAWDWGLDASVPAEKALAQQFLTWLLAPGPEGMAAYNARRLGVMYVIYDGRIWSSYQAADGWRAYSGGESHGGHLHISLAWNGAMQRTSWWTGKAAAVDFGPCPVIEGAVAPTRTGPQATPCPAPVSAMSLTASPLLRREATGPFVTQLQRLLSVTPVSGFFGPVTEAAVTSLQQRSGLPVTGTTTEATWAEARRSGGGAPPVASPAAPLAAPVVAGRALPSRMVYSVRSGDSLSVIAKRWSSTVPAIRSATGLSERTQDVIRVGQQITVPVRSGITKFTWTTLRKGDRSVAVKALQTALGMRPKYRTGLFGDITQGRVDALKSQRGWPADGAAGPGVWRALGA
ncbi:MAG: peptidoglycan-binding protein [Pseudonocardia sp.]|nr:peptidoglycan-binding protein [Pseudonocardia sp.]